MAGIHKIKFNPGKGKNSNCYSNGERAARGQEMINLHPDSSLPGSEPITNATDVIADLLHWLDSQGVGNKAETILTQAKILWMQER